MSIDIDAVKAGGRSVSQLTAQLYEAARADSVVGIRTLLALGADPHLRGQNGGTALHLAANLGNTSAVVELLESSTADANAMTAGGWLPLHLAARGGHLAVVDALLSADADPLALDGRGQTALIVAAAHGQLGCLRRLADETPEADSLDHTDDAGSTALHYACLKGHSPCACELVRRNATASLPNAGGLPPAKVAAASGHAQTAVDVAVAERMASLARRGQLDSVREGSAIQRQLSSYNPKQHLYRR